MSGENLKAMPGSWPQQDHPHLNDQNCAETSGKANRYNCIAWAAGIDTDWWWPDARGIGKWPPSAPRAITMQAFVEAFASLGYKLCYNSTLESGLEKIAIYGRVSKSTGETIPTHAALQLASGEWTSKMGPLEDIQHTTADDVNGPVYGKPIYYMSRPRRL